LQGVQGFIMQPVIHAGTIFRSGRLPVDTQLSAC
jgi:hypothetical protein